MALNNIRKSYLARFLRDLNFFGAIMVPYFLDWLQVDYTMIFILQAWFVLWVVLLEIPTGVVADRFGRKISLALGVLLLGADYVMYGFTQSYVILFVAEFIGAVGITMVSGADKALIYDSLIETGQTKDSKRYLARHDAAGTLGIVLSFPLGSLLAGSSALSYPHSLTVPFLLSGASSFLAVFCYLTMKEPKRARPTENFVELGISGINHLRRHKVLRSFALNSIFISAVTFFMFWFYQALLRSVSLPVAVFGFVGGGANALAAVLLLNVKTIERLFGMRRILFFSALIPGLLFVALGFFRSVPFVIVGVTLVIALKLLRAPILSDFMNKHIESANRATVLSSVSLLERVMIGILYPVVGFLADIRLGYALATLGILALAFTFATRIEEANIA